MSGTRRKWGTPLVPTEGFVAPSSSTNRQQTKTSETTVAGIDVHDGLFVDAPDALSADRQVETTAQRQQQQAEHHPMTMAPENDGTIVRHIASYLSLSDVASLAGSEIQPIAMGESRSYSSFTLMTTPETPGLMALSPDEGGAYLDDDIDAGSQEPDGEMMDVHLPIEDDIAVRSRLASRRRQMVQEKLSAAIFAHPSSLRSFCLDAHNAAVRIKRNRQLQQQQLDPETFVEPNGPIDHEDRARREFHLRVFRRLVDIFLRNVPLTVTLDVIDAIRELGLDTSFAVFQLGISSLNALVQILLRVLRKMWETISNFNPLALLDAIISLQFNAMGRTSEVLVSGIQSVATGVGSASNMALSRLSRNNGHCSNMASSTSLNGGSSAHLLMSLRRNKNEIFNQKLLKKLSAQQSAAEVISYLEREDEALTRHAKKRVQRMMHYDVSLRPFVATVKLAEHRDQKRDDSKSRGNDNEQEEDGSPDSSDSPFLCTPMSFPPTPASRSQVLSRGNRFSEDVVFLARDKLRVEDGLDSENERTRAMARALREGSRLAVFNAADVASGIALTCGQHVATKVCGNVLYASTRSMVPILRNCFVYFEMSILSPPHGSILLQSSMATLSVGLSTLEMPLNTLVGAWKGSVGLCSTGQILTAGQWASPSDPNLSSYGDSATVGCLVCLDDGSAFDTWDGVNISAAVTFNVNGRVVSPPVSTTPMATIGIGGMPHLQSQELPGLMPPLSTLPLLVPIEEELFPTLTLHSPATRVMCRFSAEDSLAASRNEIGAPEGVTVYAIDGSVLFDAGE